MRAGRRRGRRRRAAAIIAIGAALVFCGLFHRFLFLGNLAVVEAGKLYRCAQPKGDAPALVRGQGIRSILNLRGGSPADWWYREEVEAAERLDVDFYDLPMDAKRRPTRGELLALLDLYKRAPYPLLVHCKSGSDRTGLAVALYLCDVKGLSPEESLGAFSIWRGHIPFFGPEKLHEPLREYASWLGAQGLEHSPGRLEDWVREFYRSGRPGDNGGLEPIEEGSRFERLREKSREPSRINE